MKLRLDVLPAVVAAVLLPLTPLPGIAGSAGEPVGLAYDLESNELLYRETHCLNADGSEREVLYHDPQGELIARKLVDYSSGVTTPSFVQHNHYSSQSIEVGLQQDGIRMAVRDSDSGSTLRSAVAEPSEALPVVIDAGFDGFVRQHWSQLVDGEKREFQFPFADQESLVELRIQPQACSYDGTADQCFRLDLANWFLRMMVKPIELGYDAETRQLTRFRGLSNIGDAQGNGLEVEIRYSYQAEASPACQNLTQAHGARDSRPVGS